MQATKPSKSTPSLLHAYLMAIVWWTWLLRVKPGGQEGLCHGRRKGLSIFLISFKVLASQVLSRILCKSVNQNYSASPGKAREMPCQQVSPLLRMSHQLPPWPNSSSARKHPWLHNQRKGQIERVRGFVSMDPCGAHTLSPLSLPDSVTGRCKAPWSPPSWTGWTPARLCCHAGIQCKKALRNDP